METKKQKEDEEKLQQEGKRQSKASFDTLKHEGGSIITNKSFEPLGNILMACKSRLKL